MRIIRFDSQEFVPAGHENPLAPGVVKKVLFKKADLQPGQIQMVNWSSLAVGNRFAKHYHEDMQEFFIVMQGETQITVGDETTTLGRGDAILIDAREVHEMYNAGSVTVEYLAVGITSDTGGKTVLVDA
jgi:mannose-6-phosphate isomerase-like protein (cupin superfamily)